MDLSPEYVALADDLASRLRARRLFHQWSDGEYLYCPTSKGFAINLADHADELHDDDVWLPRLDQLVELAGREWCGSFVLNFERTSELEWGKWGAMGAGNMWHGETPERAVMRMILAAL